MDNLTYLTSNSTNSSIVNKVSSGLMGFCLVMGIPGNIAVMVIILRHFKKDNFTLHLMLNLACSDMMFLMTLPIWIAYWNFDLQLSEGLCKFLYYLVFANMYCSVMTVTLMSVQRYVVVLYRNQWAKLGRKGERVLLFCLWMLAFFLAGPSAFKAGIVEDRQLHRCWIISRFNKETLASLLCETLLGFALPLSIIASSYYSLHKKVNQTALFSNQRLTRLITSIVVTFVILWLPGHFLNVVLILRIALKSTNPSVSDKCYAVWDVSSNAVNGFTCLNTCVNPLLYACRYNELFKQPKKPERTVGHTQTSGV